MKDVRFRIRLMSIAAAVLVLVLTSGGLPDPAQSTNSSAPNSPASENKVDINSATMEQLLKVPGMTRTWAVRIIRFRPYHAKNDLLDRGVVTSQAYDRIKNYIIAHREKQ